MYHLHWTLEDIRKLSLPQLNWIIKELERQKKKEARAMKGKR